jgi:hypothetical protein
MTPKLPSGIAEAQSRIRSSKDAHRLLDEFADHTAEDYKGSLFTSSGVSYASAPVGAQRYDAGSLVR